MHSMEFEVMCARREGKLVPRWQLGSMPKHRGRLCVRDESIDDLRRLSRCAAIQGKGKTLLKLWDAQLINTMFGTWVMTGFERIETDSGDSRDFAQTWLMTPVDTLD